METLATPLLWFVTACGAALAVQVAWIFIIRPLRIAGKLRAQGVNATPFIPLFGDLRFFLANRDTLPDAFYKSFELLTERYGTPFVFFFGPEVRVVLSEPDLVREVLGRQSYVFEKTSILKKVLGGILGLHSLLLSEGDDHKRHRKIASSAFHFSALQGLVPLMSECAVLAAERWAARVAGAVAQAGGGSSAAPTRTEGAPAATGAQAATGGWVELEMHTLVTQVTLDIVGQSAFATSKARGGDDAPAYAVVSTSMEERASSGVSLALVIPGWDSLPTPGNRRNAEFVARVRSLCLQLVQERRAFRAAAAAAAVAAPTAACQAARTTLLDLLLDARDEAEAAGSHGASAGTGSGASGGGGGGGEISGLTDDEVVDQAVTFLLAGHETTAQSISWTMYLLAKHPEWQARLREEVWSVCGRPTEGGQVGAAPDSSNTGSGSGGSTGGQLRSPTYEDLGALPQLGWVIHESARLYPPVTQISRTATTDVTLEPSASKGGSAALRPLRIPAGAGIQVPIALIHRDSRWWDDPHEFKPERFRDGIAAASRHPLAFIPFSHGPRNCIGAQFALLEAKAVLAVLLQRFEWTLSPNYKHKPFAIITLQPRYGMPLLMRPAGSGSSGIC